MRRAALVILAALFLGAVLGADPARAEACAPDRVDLRGDWGTAQFRVEVADDDAERARGLMFRKELAPLAGMIFFYDSPRRVSFWMRNTLIGLDMLFVDPAGRVKRIHRNARPLDETQIDGGPGVLAVLEINAGMAAALGIEPGTELRHPGFDAERAAWPCPS